MLRPITFALLVGLVFAASSSAEDYAKAKIVKLEKGQIELEHDGKTVRLDVALKMRVIDDQGKSQDPLSGLRYLVPGNIVDVTTAKSSLTGKVEITEIKYISGKIADLPKTTLPKDIDLRPIADFKDKVFDASLPKDMKDYFPKAKVGDFIEFKLGTQEGPSRKEVIERGKDYLVVAHVSYFTGKRDERRFKWMVQPGDLSSGEPNKPAKPKPTSTKMEKPKEKATTKSKEKSKESSKTKTKTKTAPEPEPKLPDTEELTVSDKQVTCQVKREKNVTTWTSDDVPFDGLVKKDAPQFHYTLLDFGWGN